ncbi:LysR substrate-binding domain-containing protein [Secundilactobacillus collinoides]|uniref:LysR substrate-binding domain-containing protein n=1 Tax=Secundilactobacillus collinoides TaxID=33960 RepID=UPI001585BF40
MSTSDEIHGSLTIGVTSIFARFRLPDLLKKYLELNPQVNISVKTGRSWDVYPLLKKSGNSGSYTSRRLCMERRQTTSR